MGMDGEIRFRLVGEYEIKLVGKDGAVKEVRRGKNVITNAGKAQVAGLINGVVTTPFRYIAIGTGTTAPAATDTALATETHRKLADSVSRATTNVDNDTALLVATFSGYTGTEAVTESGVFDASSGGNMLCRQTFSAINVDWGAGDSLQITWKIVVTA
jgi:hypothetical protein